MTLNNIVLCLTIGMLSFAMTDRSFATDGVSDSASSCTKERCTLEREQAEELVNKMRAEKSTTLVIPENYTEIGYGAFFECRDIKSVVMRGPVTSIGVGAFAACGIKSFDIPPSVQQIGGQAFAGTDLESIIVPKTVKSVGDDAFSYCPNLKKIVMYCDSFGYIHECESLTDVEISGDTSELYQAMFFKCPMLKNVTLNDKVRYIGRFAFNECPSLESITIPASVSSISHELFRKNDHCTVVVSHEGAKQLLVNKGIKNNVIVKPSSSTEQFACYWPNDGKLVITKTCCNISPEMFYGRDDLVSVTIPGHIKQIGPSAFDRCRNIRRIEILDGVEKIEGCAFDFCDNVEEFIIPASVKEIGYHNSFKPKNITIKHKAGQRSDAEKLREILPYDARNHSTIQFVEY